jgi:hypothetical protein
VADLEKLMTTPGPKKSVHLAKKANGEITGAIISR